jgi:hypothetical protein
VALHVVLQEALHKVLHDASERGSSKWGEKPEEERTRNNAYYNGLLVHALRSEQYEYIYPLYSLVQS